MRVFLIVLDGVGLGPPDAADRSIHTLEHLAATAGGLRVRTLERLGLGHLTGLPGVAAPVDPSGARGTLRPLASGADCRTGFHELAGVVLDESSSEPAPPARRPRPGREPEQPTLLERLHERGVPVRTVGRVHDLFAGRGVRDAIATANDEESAEVLLDLARRRGDGLVFAEFLEPVRCGRGPDRVAFARALERFDSRLDEFLGRIGDDDLCMVTADHGNDPADGGTGATRECVPLLIGGRRVRRNADIGVRRSFADVGATLAELFGSRTLAHGASFLREIRG